jgi:4-hydroxyphenylpyruvate dioxygenase
MIKHATNREDVPEMHNRLGIEGIEFIEYATTKPQALGQVLENMGFRPVARHRSREVTLYRQGGMNLVVNASPDDARVTRTAAQGQAVISAVAFRVQDALKAHTRCLELPAIHGPGGSRFYFVDRWKEFSIYDIDFKPIPTVDQHPAALGDMNYFGVVQYIGAQRSAEWMAYFEHMFDFTIVPDDQRFGILPKGHLLQSPCGQFLWQLIEPDPWMEDDNDAPESLHRIGLGVKDVGAMVQQLKARGIEFVESSQLHPEDRGALTRTMLGNISFELVHQD